MGSISILCVSPGEILQSSLEMITVKPSICACIIESHKNCFLEFGSNIPYEALSRGKIVLAYSPPRRFDTHSLSVANNWSQREKAKSHRECVAEAEARRERYLSA